MKKDLVRNIANYMVDEGLYLTGDGTYSFYYEDIEELFQVILDKESVEDIVGEIMRTREEVLDVWGPEETGEEVFDLTFGTDYYDSGEDDEEDEDWDDDTSREEYDRVNAQVENAVRGWFGLPEKE